MNGCIDSAEYLFFLCLWLRLSGCAVVGLLVGISSSASITISTNQLGAA